jgi:signal transduction histidine kinase
MYARHQAALAELTQSVLARTDRRTLMGRAVTLAAHTLAVAYCAIWEQLPDGDALVFRAGAGWQEDRGEDMTVEVGSASPINSALAGATPTIVADWLSETRFSRPQALRDRGVISSAYVVIPGDVHPFGVLGVDVTASRLFNDEEIHFLEAVANVVALAIAQGQSHQAIERRVEERTRDIEQRLVAAAQDTAVLEERQRLARDLHDSVTQALYGITLHAQAARRLLSSGDGASAADSLRALQNTAQEALDEMRLLIFELRPPVLEQIGLAAALQARLTAVEGRANLQTRLIAEEIDNLPSPVEQALYRIAQEALNNALKHAHAQRITVQLRQAQRRVILEIADDGLGFDPAGACQNGGLGLRGIAERVAQLDGTLTLQSTPGSGTRLSVEVAL